MEFQNCSRESLHAGSRLSGSDLYSRNSITTASTSQIELVLNLFSNLVKDDVAVTWKR